MNQDVKSLDMGEVKRLVSELTAGAHDSMTLGDYTDEEAARSALLDYVRDHFRDATKMVPDERQLFESWVVREAGTGAAKRWFGTDAYENLRINDYRTGWTACLELMITTKQPVGEVADLISRQQSIGPEIGRVLADNMDALVLASNPVGEVPTQCGECHLQSGERCDVCGAVSEVPMPEPTATFYIDEQTGRWSEYMRPPAKLTEGDARLYDGPALHAYGEQCRAAGYAAGVAHGRLVREVTDALFDAALRGEVTP